MFRKIIGGGLCILSFASSLFAQTVADPFSEFQDSAWVKNRYEPHFFGYNPSFNGGSSLDIEISEAENTDNRPSEFGSNFYNVQGRGLNTPAPFDFTDSTYSISTTLYLSGSLQTNLQRTDVWVRSSTDINQLDEGNAHYDIFGITNYGATSAVTVPSVDGNSTVPTPRFRYFDSNVGWTDLYFLQTGDLDQWWTLTLTLSNTAGVTTETFSVSNGLDTYSDSIALGNKTAISDVQLQAYNFTSTSFNPTGGQYTNDGYTVHWAQNVVPEPSGGLLTCAGLSFLVGLYRRRQ